MEYYLIPTYAILALLLAYVGLSTLFTYKRRAKASFVVSTVVLLAIALLASLMAASPLNYTLANTLHVSCR